MKTFFTVIMTLGAVGLLMGTIILFMDTQAGKPDPYPECLEFTKGSFVNHKRLPELNNMFVLDDSEYYVYVRFQNGDTRMFGCWEMELVK